MLEEIGFERLRSGKGDHTVFARRTERVVLDGGPNYELPKGQWKKLCKAYALKGRAWKS